MENHYSNSRCSSFFSICRKCYTQSAVHMVKYKGSLYSRKTEFKPWSNILFKMQNNNNKIQWQTNTMHSICSSNIYFQIRFIIPFDNYTIYIRFISFWTSFHCSSKPYLHGCRTRQWKIFHGKWSGRTLHPHSFMIQTLWTAWKKIEEY